MRHFALAFALLLLLAVLPTTAFSQSAFGQQGDFRASWPSIDLWTDYVVLVAVSDQRPYVINGDKTPDFIGLNRSMIGIPYDVLTASRASLAMDLEEAVTNGLLNSGVIATAQSDNGEEESEVYAANRKLLLALVEWKGDTYKDTTLHYDFTVAIYDGKDQLIAQRRFVGKRTDTSSVDAARKVLTEAISSVEIIRALDSEYVSSDEGPEQDADADPPAQVSEIYDDLIKLKELLDKGIISEEEFVEQKRRVLQSQ